MFGDAPHKLLPGAQIELIQFHSPEAEGSSDFTEKTFTGPVQKQVRDALAYLNAVLFVEKVIKYTDRAEADRFYNYPYDAIEEVLVNAVFHKSYRLQEPVEIRVYVDCIKVINHPGPEKTIDMDELRAGQAISRRYRNRRIGEFLKEIELAERKSTGITKILRALENNGSPPPEFKTNDERDYLIVTIHQHEGFRDAENINNAGGVNGGVNGGYSRQNQIIIAIKEMPNITVEQIAERIGISKRTVEREIKAMRNMIIKRVGSDKTGYWEIIE